MSIGMRMRMRMKMSMRIRIDPRPNTPGMKRLGQKRPAGEVVTPQVSVTVGVGSATLLGKPQRSHTGCSGGSATGLVALGDGLPTRKTGSPSALRRKSGCAGR
jgi:hypothetical protein